MDKQQAITTLRAIRGSPTTILLYLLIRRQAVTQAASADYTDCFFSHFYLRMMFFLSFYRQLHCKQGQSVIISGYESDRIHKKQGI